MKRIYLLVATAMLAWSAQAQWTDLTQVGWNPDRGDFAVADIDGDGDMDVIYSANDPDKAGVGNNAVWINNNGTLELQDASKVVVTMGRSGNIEFGDINGDGHIDLIFAGWNNGSSTTNRGIALGDGTGNFVLADKADYPMTELDNVTSCGFADFNLDGLLDYYAFANAVDGEEGAWQNNNFIYFQQADGSFVENSTAIPGSQYKFFESGVTVIDFNADGAPDIWFNTNDNTKSCESRQEAQRLNLLFINNGDGTFREFSLNVGTDLLYYKSNGSATWADMDGDGYLDLLHNGDGFLCTGEDNDQIWRLYKNNAGQSLTMTFDFGENHPGRQNSINNGGALVDWNGDGVMDIITAGWSGDWGNTQRLDLWLGNADNRMAAFTATTFGTGVPGFSEQGIRIADINGDGKPDMLVNGYSNMTTSAEDEDDDHRQVGWIANTSSAAAPIPGAPTALATDNGVGYVGFSWAAPEGLSNAAGITYNFSLYNKTTGKWLYNPMANEDGKRIVAGRMGNVYTAKEYYLFGLPAGEYEWTVQAINGQYMGGAFAAKQTFTVGASGVESVSGYNPGVFVNDNTLSIVGMQGEAQTVNVYSISGALLNTAAFNDNIDLQLPQAGIYMVEVQAADGGQYITKVVVK